MKPIGISFQKQERSNHEESESEEIGEGRRSRNYF